MVVITVAGDLPVGIGVERRPRPRWPGADAVDVGLVDVDLDLERRHVDDGADAGAGEAAAGRDRRDHLAGLGVLGDHDAGERRADRRCRRAPGAQTLDLALGHRHLLAAGCRGAPPGRRARRARGRARAWLATSLGHQLLLPRAASSSASSQRTSVSAQRARAAAELGLGQLQPGARRWRRRAGPGPGPRATSMPSSTSTSTTLPVIFDETVAWRRAVT